MSTSNVFNTYNKVLLKENYYNYLYNPSKIKNQRKVVLSLANAIKNHDNNYELNSEKNNDSLTTIDAMYNPYMLKLTEEDQSPIDNIILKNKNYIMNEIKQRQKTAKKRPYGRFFLYISKKSCTFARKIACYEKNHPYKRPCGRVFARRMYRL